LSTFILKTSTPWAVRLSWLENAYSRPLFRRPILTRKIGQPDLVWYAIMVHPYACKTTVYKSLCAAVTICSTL